MTEAVDLIRDLNEALTRAWLELCSPGSMQGRDLSKQIETVLSRADEFLDIEDGEDDDAAAKAAEILGIELDAAAGV